MKPTPPTSGEILDEVIGLAGGLAAGLLPLFLLAVPGIVLFVVLPALLLLALALPLAAIGALLALPPYLLTRLRRRRRSRAAAGLRPHAAVG